MAILEKLADCLNQLGRAHRISPPIRLELIPTADPEVAFGWQGNLFADANTSLGPVSAPTTLASVTIVEDCFYELDAAYHQTPQVASTVATSRLRLEILDPTGAVTWAIAVGATATALGYSASQSLPTLRVHLLSGMVVRWRVIEATPAFSTNYIVSIALRKLYQDQL